MDSTGSIGSKTSEGVRSEGSEARSQASLADGRSATEEAAYGTDGTVGRESDARSLGSKQSGKPRAMIDSKDLKVCCHANHLAARSSLLVCVRHADSRYMTTTHTHSLPVASIHCR